MPRKPQQLEEGTCGDQSIRECVSSVDVRWSPEAGQTRGDVSSMARVFSADCSPLCAAGGIQIEFICLGQFQFKYPAPGPGDGAAAN